VAGYRFCRSDDLPSLVEAYNACYAVHFPEPPELTADGFKRWIREIQVWPSSCMLAAGERGEPIGVLIGAKRATATRVVALGIRPDRLREGHGGHMLSSLVSKLAILGPPRIVAEIPETWSDARACFEAAHFLAERTYTDFALDGEGGELRIEPHSLVGPIGVEEAVSAGVLAAAAGSICWDRSEEALFARREHVRGLAIASESRIEACLLYSLGKPDEPCRIERLHVADPLRGDPVAARLLGQLLYSVRRPLRFPRVHEDEVPFQALSRWGFAPARRTVEYAHMAGPA